MPNAHHQVERTLPLFCEGHPESSDVDTVIDAKGQEESAFSAEDLQRKTKAFRLNLLSLSAIKGLGVQALKALLTEFGQLDSVWQGPSERLRLTFAKAHIPSSERLAHEIVDSRARLLDLGAAAYQELVAQNVNLVPDWHPEFPHGLKHLADRPRWLFVQGELRTLNDAVLVAIVGTREASDLGIKTAERLAYLTVMEGLSLVSGLAEGIDAAAHRVAALYNVPQVAVLGTGIQLVFPASTARLREQLLSDGGAVVTEYLPEDRYSRASFVERNRIQAGLAAAVCPVEGRLRSGTMHTLRFAERYGRKVFGVRRGTAAPESEITALLSMRGTPVFDLDTENGRSKLRAFFHQLAGPRLPAPSRASHEVLFAEVLNAFDAALSQFRPNPSEVRWLVDEILRRTGML